MDTLYINSVCTSQETNFVAIRKTKRLMQFMEFMVVYSENRTKRINTLCGENTRPFFSYSRRYI
jgi:hypothetical protein